MVVSELVDKNPSEDGRSDQKYKEWSIQNVNIINHTGRCY
jgi:hypothetical protein